MCDSAGNGHENDYYLSAVALPVLAGINFSIIYKLFEWVVLPSR